MVPCSAVMRRASSTIDFGGALNVALVLEPLAVAHVGAKSKENRAASERGIFAEELTNKLQRGAPVRVPHLVEFFLHGHAESQSSAGFEPAPGAEGVNQTDDGALVALRQGSHLLESLPEPPISVEAF